MYESGEDYLETILTLKKKKEYVRSIDIANEFGYSKASISRAMGVLKDTGYIFMDENNYIEFTEKGLIKATQILERHNLIFSFLKDVLGVNEDIADKDACKIEHIISDETFIKLKEHIQKG
ncbi:MAG: metal-dependent transcriptional regulator [Oscillospiraceae bacterium]